MTSFVDASTYVVKKESFEAVDICRRERHKGAVTTLAQRLQWVIDDGRVKSARAWSIEAGLTPQQVSTMIDREQVDGKVATVRKLAAAAKVSYVWLSQGVGSPDDQESTVETAQRYESRLRASERARADGIDPRAILDVLQERLQHLDDPGETAWYDLMKARNAFYRGRSHTHEHEPDDG